MAKKTSPVERLANEAVSRLLRRMLTVPKVFFSVQWPDERTDVDVLAVDRAGAGDVHVVEVRGRFDSVTTSVVRRLISVPAHYRWIAVPTRRISQQFISHLQKTLTAQSIGMIGVVIMSNGEPGANVLSQPLRAMSIDRMMLGKFLQRTVPDIHYGEAPLPSESDAVAPLPKKKIELVLNEALDLLTKGYESASFLRAWSATEAAMRLAAGALRRPHMLSPRALIAELRDRGMLSTSELSIIINALETRNVLIHGLDVPLHAADATRHLILVARKVMRKAR